RSTPPQFPLCSRGQTMPAYARLRSAPPAAIVSSSRTYWTSRSLKPPPRGATPFPTSLPPTSTSDRASASRNLGARLQVRQQLGGGRARVAVVRRDAQVGRDRLLVMRIGHTRPRRAQVGGRVDVHLDEAMHRGPQRIAIGAQRRVDRDDRRDAVLG